MPDFALATGYVRQFLGLLDEEAARLSQEYARLEADGWLLIKADYEFSDPNPDGYEAETSIIRDYRTGAELARDTSTFHGDDEYERAMDAAATVAGKPLYDVAHVLDDLREDNEKFVMGPDHELKDTDLGHALLAWTDGNQEGVHAWLDAGADHDVLDTAIEWALAVEQKLDYLKAEGFVPVTIMGPHNFPGSGKPDLWHVFVDGAVDNRGFDYQGDRAGLDKRLRERNMIEMDSDKLVPVPGGIAGELARQLDPTRVSGALDELIEDAL